MWVKYMILSVIPSLHAFDENDELQSLNSAGVFAPKILLVPRQDCTFKRVRLLNDRAPAEKAAVLKARSEALNANVEVIVVRDSEGLGAGLWTYSRVDPRLRHLPETLLVPHGNQEVRLISCLSGVEGQIWNGVSLIASRWWLTAPSESDWLSFLHSAELPDNVQESSQAQPLNVEYSAKVPLLTRDRAQFQRALPASRVFGIVACFFVLCFVYQGTKFLHYSIQEARLERDIKAISEQVADSRRLRGEALSNLKFSEDYNSLTSSINVFEVLTVFASVLAEENVSLRSIVIRDESVEIRVIGEITMPEPEFVRAIEKGSTLQDVRITARVRNSVTISAKHFREGFLSKAQGRDSDTNAQ